jgi:hypothetical protein
MRIADEVTPLLAELLGLLRLDCRTAIHAETPCLFKTARISGDGSRMHGNADREPSLNDEHVLHTNL